MSQHQMNTFFEYMILPNESIPTIDDSGPNFWRINKLIKINKTKHLK
jgi:hypothetical protein